jgi:hypothetical protein
MRFSSVLVGVCLTSLCNLGQAADPPKIIAAGEWSKPVADNRGCAVRGRLVVGEKPADEDQVRARGRTIVVYVELQDASDFVGNSLRIFCEMGKHDFRPEYKPGLQCEMRDTEQRLVPTTGFPFGGAVPKSEWVTLPADGTIRVRATPFGIRRPGGWAISPHLNSLWVIGDDDPKEYFLSGTFTVAPADDQIPAGEEHVWRGSIVLPPARIQNKKP